MENLHDVVVMMVSNTTVLTQDVAQLLSAAPNVAEGVAEQLMSVEFLADWAETVRDDGWYA